jgi:hypothetical protein
MKDQAQGVPAGFADSNDFMKENVADTCRRFNLKHTATSNQEEIESVEVSRDQATFRTSSYDVEGMLRATNVSACDPGPVVGSDFRKRPSRREGLTKFSGNCIWQTLYTDQRDSSRKNAALSADEKMYSSWPCALTVSCGSWNGNGPNPVARLVVFCTPMVSL